MRHDSRDLRNKYFDFILLDVPNNKQTLTLLEVAIWIQILVDQTKLYYCFAN